MLSNLLSKLIQGAVEPALEDSPTRVSSFPFLSGDTFRLMAGAEYHDGVVTVRPGLPENIFFTQGDLLDDPGLREAVEAYFATRGEKKRVLIVHNSDTTLSPTAFETVSELFTTVFAVNVVEESKIVRAIPIGLENAWRNKNGKLAGLLDAGPLASSDSRERLVLSSFHPATNPGVRGPLQQSLKKSRFGFDGVSWKRGEYREILRHTKFVLSPPGNGPDCHRTWEAIYCGAVPVVLSDALSPALASDLPVLAVSSYDDFLELSDRELDGLYRDMIVRPKDKAYAPYWVSEIQRAAGALE